MKLVTSLLLSSAAVLTAAAGAQAADLPSRKAAPVEYVKICSVYGAGFFYIPGTDTCLRIGGYVRAEYDYTPGQNIISPAMTPVTVGGTSATAVTTFSGGGAVTQVGADQDQTGMEIRGRIDLDARTQTDWGTVQTVVNLRGANTDGIRTVGSTANFQTAYNPAGNGSTGITMERAYIRFAGFTAGVASENASTMPAYMYSSNVYAGFPNGIKELVYTATFAGGFSATLGIESRGDFGYDKPVALTTASTPGANIPGPSLVSTTAPSTYVNQFDTGYILVGNVRVDQTWGYAQLAGLLSNDSAVCNNTGATVSGQATGVCATANNPLLGPTKYGAWGLIGSFRINLPMIAPGDTFHFQAAYGNGMDGAVISSGSLSTLSDASNKRVLGGVIRADSNLVPVTVNTDGTVASYGQETAWGVYGLFTHYWMPTWRSNLALGYAEFNPPTAYANLSGNCSVVGNTYVTAGNHPTACAGLNTQWGKGDLFQAALNLIWSPTKNFDIGVEAEYLHLNSTLQNAPVGFTAAGSPGLTEDGFIYHLRVERTF